jgi:carboxylesterase type B
MGSVCLFFLAVFFNCCLTAPTVKTRCGEVIGTFDTNTKLNSFLGIPYAASTAPPNRWKPPINYCWNGTLNATNPGPACPNLVLRDRPMSETCLHLNIFTRSLPTEGGNDASWPVIFWIHGGSNTDGSNVATWYSNLTTIAIKKDVVLVAANYRLGLLGYLALRELSEADPRGVSGNYGILDLQFALKWVQNNIAAFGGDPKLVTLLGQSSGGTNIFSLVSSPASSGLFSAAISLSGSPNITMDLQQAEHQNRKQFLEITPCANATNIIQCLNNLTYEQITTYTSACYTTPGQLPPLGINGNGWCGLTIADGVTVKNIFDAAAEGTIDVPQIIQTAQAEMDLFADPTQRKMNEAQLEAFLKQWFLTNGWNQNAFDAWKQLYANYISKSAELTLYGWITDIYFTCGCQLFGVTAGTGLKSPIYLGIVNYPPSHPHPAGGGGNMSYAFHSWDFEAATGAWLEQGHFVPEQNDIVFGETQLGIWYELASTGKVNSYGWEPINNSKNFPTDFKVGVHQNPNNITTIDSYYKSTCNTLPQAPLFMGMNFWIVNK